MKKERIIVIAVFGAIWLLASLYELLFKKKKTKNKNVEEVIEEENEEVNVNETEGEDGDEEYLECPYCGSLNLKSELKCLRCGAPLRKKRKKRK